VYYAHDDLKRLYQVQLFYSTIHTAQRVYAILMANVSHFGDQFSIQPAFFVEPAPIIEPVEPQQPAPPKSYVVLQGLPRALAKQKAASAPGDSDFVLVDNSDLEQVVKTLLPPNPSAPTNAVTPPPGGVIFSSEDDWEEINPDEDIVLSRSVAASSAVSSQNAGQSVPFPKSKSNYMQNDIYVESAAAPNAAPAPSDELSDVISDIAYSALKSQSGKSTIPDSSRSEWNHFLQERTARSNVDSGSTQV
jgi:hypothetical protein